MGGSFKRKHQFEEIVLLTRKAEKTFREGWFRFTKRRTVVFSNMHLKPFPLVNDLRQGVDYQIIKHSGEWGRIE